MIRKGQVRWMSDSDVRRQIQFINKLFEVVAWDGAWSTRPITLLLLFASCNTSLLTAHPGVPQIMRHSPLVIRTQADSANAGHRQVET